MAEPSPTLCCLNPKCEEPLNPGHHKFCQSCGEPLQPLRNRYVSQRLLSDEGGFGRTYLAADLDKLNRTCVIKQLAPQLQGGTTANQSMFRKAKELFEREAEQLASLGEHPQIPYLLAYFEEGGQFYLVQEFIDGAPLHKLKPDQLWPENEVKDFLRGILPVIDFIHSKGVIHRDLKPPNILRRDRDGKYILIDFGASKEIINQTVAMAGATRIGTNGYAPYEQMGEGQTNFASDLYSLGVVCFYLLTLQDAYYLFLDDGYGWVERWQHYIPATQTVSPAFRMVLDRLLKKQPSDRWQSATQVLTALDAAQTANDSTVAMEFPQQRNAPAPIPPATTPAPPATISNTVKIGKKEPSVQESRRLFLKLVTLGGLGAIGFSGLRRFMQLVQQDNPPPPPPEFLEEFYFDTVQVNSSGDIINTSPGEGLQYVEFLGNDVYLKMVEIPGGSFAMGTPDAEIDRLLNIYEFDAFNHEYPQHEVAIAPFLLGKFVVTQQQWQQIMGSNPSNFTETLWHPVDSVSWYSCQDFLRALREVTGKNYRLPSEAEWEYACRAGTNTPFYYGETITTDIANYLGSSVYGNGPVGVEYGSTLEVGSFPPNGFGLYDIHGNVWEWCEDDFVRDYVDPRAQTPYVINSEMKTLRGGSYYYEVYGCRSAFRVGYGADQTGTGVGLRLALDLDQVT